MLIARDGLVTMFRDGAGRQYREQGNAVSDAKIPSKPEMLIVLD
jgi:hypothetical protein